MARRELLENIPADLACERLAERHLAPRRLGGFLRQHDHPIFSLAKRQLQRVGEPAPLVHGRQQPVDDQFHRQLLRARTGRNQLGIVEVLDLAVEPYPLKPPQPHPRQLIAQHTRLRPHERRQQHHPFSGTLGQHAPHIVIKRALHHPPSVLRTTLFTGERPEQLRVICDLRHGGDRAARRASARALFDRQHRGESVDEVDVRPLELIQHLPGLGRQALHVFAVALRVNRVEGQRGLPRSARPRDHD